MGVLPDEAADVGRGFFAEVAFDDEERVEFLGEFLLAAEHFYKSVNIVWNEPSVLPSVAFREIVGTMRRAEWIERCATLTLRRQAFQETVRRVEMLLVEFAALHKILIISLFAEFFRHLRHAPVGQRIFESFRNGFIGSFEVERQITVLFQVFQTALVEHCRCFHRVVSLFKIRLFDKAFQDEVRQHGNARISHHTISFVAHQMPDGKFSLFLENM